MLVALAAAAARVVMPSLCVLVVGSTIALRSGGEEKKGAWALVRRLRYQCNPGTSVECVAHTLEVAPKDAV